jgi:hypothetical protein
MINQLILINDYHRLVTGSFKVFVDITSYFVREFDFNHIKLYDVINRIH